MKKILKIIVFFIILNIMWGGVFNVLWLGKTPLYYFFKEPKNSFDVVYVGASNVYRNFNSVLAYDLYGYTTGLLATDSQPFATVRYLIDESQKYQTPKLYIIDICTLVLDFNKIDDPQIRKTLDSMKFSKNRIAAYNEMLPYINVNKQEYRDYYFSFFMYHNRWKNLSKNSFTDDKTLYKGYYFSKIMLDKISRAHNDWDNNVSKLPKRNKKVLDTLLNYIQQNNINVIFVISNRYYSEKYLERFNESMSIIKNRGYKVINFNNLNDFKLDYKKDFYDQGHANVYGSTKYSLYFSKYLKENYDLPDHREDEKYKSWDKEYKRFKTDFKKLTNKDFNKLLSKYQNNKEK